MGYDEAVVIILCGEKKYDENGEINNENCIVGTGFFVDKDIIITANHVISNYYDIGDDVYVNPINLEDKELYKAEILTPRDKFPIAILKLEKKFQVNELKFTDNYEIKEGDCWTSFGHPGLKWKRGHKQTGHVSRKLNRLNSYNCDYDLSMVNNNLDDYSGMSGSPFFIDNMLLGVIIEQSEVNRRAISMGVVSISKLKDAISQDYLVKVTMEHDMKMKPNAFNNIPYNKNFNFIGRESVLRSLENNLEESNIQILTGMSGIGKTQLAVKYSYENINRYKYVFWVRADDNVNLFNDYISIGRELSIVNSNDKSEEEAMKKVSKWFSDNNEWLLIFDNCEEYNQIYNFIPNNKQGHIIITSKNPNWNKIREPIKVDLFNEKEAHKFLLTRTGIIEEEYADELSQILGYLPLALNQAAAYIEENNISFKDYIELYNKYNLRMFEKNYDEKEYEYTIKYVWKISLSKIEGISGISIELIKFLSIFFNNKIPNWIIKKNIDKLINVFSEELDILKYNEAISILKKYALIDVNEKYCSIHCLIQTVIQNELKEKNEFNEFTENTLNFLCDILPKDLEKNEELIGVSDLIPHAYSIINLIEYIDDSYITLLYKLGVSLRINAQYNEAELKTEEALKLAEEHYGESNSKTLKVKNLLAGIIKEKGELNRAYDHYCNILKIEEEYFEDNDLNIGVTLNNIGLIEFGMGKYSKARETFTRAISYFDNEQESYGQVSTMYTNLASANLRLGEYDEFNVNINKAISIILDAYGEDSIQYARALNAKGNFLLEQKNYEEARKQYEKAIIIDENIYEKNHIEVLNKKNNLALCLANLGKEEGEEAEKLLLNSIDINTKSFGEKSEIVADNFHSLANIYFTQEKYELAVRYYSQARNLCIDFYTEYSFIFCEYTRDLANSLTMLGGKTNFDEAINLLEHVLDIDKEICSEKDQDIIANDLFRIGVLFEKMNQHQKAINRFRKCLKIKQKIYEEKSMEIGCCYGGLSESYLNKGDYNKAYTYTNKLLNCHLEHYNYYSKEIAMDYSNLAYILYELGSKSQSEKLINKSIEIINNNINISSDDVKIIKDNQELIINSNKDNILDTISKYKFETIELDGNLIIKPVLK
jgi:tetratricopeptide (TPR) repeat protein/V8-like Glu-specific endopeptidase